MGADAAEDSLETFALSLWSLGAFAGDFVFLALGFPVALCFRLLTWKRRAPQLVVS